MSSESPRRVALSLISHTNVGKTTLARTLLDRDVGTVRDAPHVTEDVDRFTMIETPRGDILELWDTPGFGDSARLARRLAQAANPIGWFLGAVWDRFRNRPFWSTQLAVRNVRDNADCVLYLVNAAERPADAGYVEPEMQVLALISKPVLVLLNQMGPPRPPQEEAAELAAWRAHLARHAIVRGVLALDAFARCWVQEVALLAAVGEILPEEKQAAFDRLRSAWQARREARFEQAMQIVAERLARAAVDGELVTTSGLAGRVRDLAVTLGFARDGTATPKQAAMQALAARLDADIRASTDRLIALHELGGSAREEILTRLAEHYAVRDRVSEGKAALVGGAVTGALAGLNADLAAGGMTFGAGLLTGGVLGALGAAGIARGYNLVAGSGPPRVAWSDGVLHELTAAAMLGYLAVAHHGRGRGDWEPLDTPAHWQTTVTAVLAERRQEFDRLWAEREAQTDSAPLAARLTAPLTAAARAVPARLYPGEPSLTRVDRE